MYCIIVLLPLVADDNKRPYLTGLPDIPIPTPLKPVEFCWNSAFAIIIYFPLTNVVPAPLPHVEFPLI